ncbi:MAG: GTP-binding protein, partial [Opitutales bacterium]|nr:GTP-binding protein [Opitutales bacterium]
CSFMQKTPVTVITGFLGSGKSTILMHLLTQCTDRRIAVVVNEFGEIGIDGNLIASCCGCEEGSLIELKNGCVCCTVQEEFLPAMKKLLNDERGFDHIVVETSGLALPKPLLRAVNWPDLKPLITVDAVITVVDADGIATGEICDRDRIQAQRLADDSIDHESSIEELFEDQLACADLVALTKCDLVDNESKAYVISCLRARLRPQIQIAEVTNGALAPEMALGLRSEAENALAHRRSRHEEDHHHHEHDDKEHEHDDNHDHGHHHHHDDGIDSIALKPGPISDPSAYIDTLRSLAESHVIFRIKGFLDVPGKPMRMVLQGVGSRFETYYDRLWQKDELRQSYVVVIGQGIADALDGTPHQH